MPVGDITSPKAPQEVANQEKKESCFFTSGHSIDAFLISTVFQKLDNDGDGWITQDEFFTFALLAELREDEMEWTGDFLEVCEQHGEDISVGISMRTFSVFVMGTHELTPRCTNADLRHVMESLPSCPTEAAAATEESQADSY